MFEISRAENTGSFQIYVISKRLVSISSWANVPLYIIWEAFLRMKANKNKFNECYTFC